MNRQTILTGCLALAFAFASPATFGSTLGNVMPVGDSITDGVPVAGGYRTQLYNDLVGASFTFNYIGTATDNASATLTGAGQVNHEGHSGYRIDQIDSSLNGYLGAIPNPDYILLLIGTNDFGQNFNTATAINRLDTLIGDITSARPNAHLIVSNLLLRTDGLDPSIQSLFNPFVPGLVSTHAGLGEKVSFLDLHSVVLAGDLADGLHPNQSGYDKMGNAWFSAIRSLQASSVPEPSTVTLLILGGVAVLGSMKRARRA